MPFKNVPGVYILLGLHKFVIPAFRLSHLKRNVK